MEAKEPPESRRRDEHVPAMGASREAAADGRHRRRHLAVRRRPSPTGRGRAAPREGPSIRSRAYPTSFRPRPPLTCSSSRAVRARLGQRLGGAGRRTPPPPARHCPRGLPFLRFERESAAAARPARTGSSTRSTPTPAGGRWPGSTTRSTTPATSGPRARPAPTLLVQTEPERGLTGARGAAARGLGARRCASGALRRRRCRRTRARRACGLGRRRRGRHRGFGPGRRRGRGHRRRGGQRERF